MREMGISKQSLYDTLGDKRSIFFRAMPRYRRSTNNSLREIFAREECVRDGFLKIFDSIILETKEQHQQGCLLMSANLSRDIHDAEKALPPGSFYTEPPDEAHFAETGDEIVTGYGPSSTDFVDRHEDPRSPTSPKPAGAN